jgi:hypothetical protein
MVLFVIVVSVVRSEMEKKLCNFGNLKHGGQIGSPGSRWKNNIKMCGNN